MVMMFVLRAMLMSGITLKIVFVLMTLFLLKIWVMPIVMGTHASSPSNSSASDRKHLLLIRELTSRIDGITHNAN
ncbi:hypothetical protein IV99_15975 [Pectobacterium brasiliense]|nr:hypothetical protein IV99_15975 [Pectobacterium brasiliense]